MKTTLDIRAKKLAKKTGRPLRAVVEDNLRAALALAEEPKQYELPDLSVGVTPKLTIRWSF